MKTSEDEIREGLRRGAETFDMPEEPPHHLVSTIRRRRSRNGMLIGLGSATLAAIVVAALTLVQPSGSGGPAVGQRGAGQTDGVALMSYVARDTKVSTGHETGAPTWLTDHVTCMREQGFDIPDPTETSDGWSIIVDDPAAAGVGTPAWREAAFVTCAIDRPLSGNLILGISKGKVDAFVTCMTEQGYELPTPTVNQDGEYAFDLTGTNIDAGGAAWDRAVFVTCSPEAGVGG